MSTSPIHPDIHSGTTDESFTVHREPLSQGGYQYLRCSDCEREVIGDDIGRLSHKATCQYSGRDQ